MESNDSPEIPDRGDTSDIPSWKKRERKSKASFRFVAYCCCFCSVLCIHVRFGAVDVYIPSGLLCRPILASTATAYLCTAPQMEDSLAQLHPSLSPPVTAGYSSSSRPMLLTAGLGGVRPTPTVCLIGWLDVSMLV